MATNNLHEVGQLFGMDSNGYSLKHDVNFETQPQLPCYLPENAEVIEDFETRDSIEKQVREWLKQDEVKEYLKETYDGKMPEITETFIQGWVRSVYEELEWAFVSTHLDNYLR